jgi:hypothetical protein
MAFCLQASLWGRIVVIVPKTGHPLFNQEFIILAAPPLRPGTGLFTLQPLWQDLVVILCQSIVQGGLEGENEESYFGMIVLFWNKPSEDEEGELRGERL